MSLGNDLGVVAECAEQMVDPAPHALAECAVQTTALRGLISRWRDAVDFPLLGASHLSERSDRPELRCDEPAAKQIRDAIETVDALAEQLLGSVAAARRSVPEPDTPDSADRTFAGGRVGRRVGPRSKDKDKDKDICIAHSPVHGPRSSVQLQATHHGQRGPR